MNTGIEPRLANSKKIKIIDPKRIKILQKRFSSQ